MQTPLIMSEGRCAVWEEPIGPAGVRIRERAVSDPLPGQVTVRVRAAGLNHLDLWVVTGAQRVEPPRVISADGAGVVEASGCDEWAVGDEVLFYPVSACWRCEHCRGGQQVRCSRFAVLGEHSDGAACELVRLPGHALRRKPVGLGWEEAAAMPLAYLTAWRMIVTRARLKAGETMLVTGGSGAVGTAAVLIGKHLGARVLATTRSKEKEPQLRAVGADGVFSSSGFSRSVLDVTDGHGADVVFEHVGAATFDESLRSAAFGGRVVTCGATSGLVTPVNLPRVFVRQLEILGSTAGNAEEFTDLVRAADEGLRPVVARTYPFAEVSDALAFLDKSDQVGKVVLTM
ncbi:zinc-binding dehydrogenase [Streptomyces sp. MMS24-I29]|uniref:zinc-binding dehydrogenase n=1 Tax=Streptomyces sp. MMS24-I29 TaxID=3351480 RepID=UPI003C7CF521